MAIVIEKKSIVDLRNNGGLFHALPKDIQILIDVITTEIDFNNVDALSVTLDTKPINAYAFVDSEEEYDNLGEEEKYYVQRTLFGMTREEYAANPKPRGKYY